MANLFVAGIDVEGLALFESCFGYEYYVTLPVLEEGLNVFRALGIRELRPTWQRTVLNGHNLFIADTDFNPAGARRIIERLRNIAAQRGITIEEAPTTKRPKVDAPLASVGRKLERPVAQRQTAVRSKLLELLRDFFPDHLANTIAYNLSDTAIRQLAHERYAYQSKREWLATKLVEKYWRGSCRAVAIDPLATKFNVVDGSGTYMDFSIKISTLPPFEVELFRVQQIGRRFVTERVFHKTVQNWT